MLNPEQQLIERSLHANFTEVQQQHFDKLMSELEQISGGLGFSEFKAKAETGDKEALQVMRDYIAKKEQVVEFIEKKEVPENEWREEELKVGDEVFILYAAHFGEKVKIIDIDDLGKVKKYHVQVSVVDDTNSRFLKDSQLAKNKPEKYYADRLSEIDLLDLKKYIDLCVDDVYSDGQEIKEIIGFMMPIAANHEDGLTIVYKATNGQTYATSYRRFKQINRGLDYKKVEKS
ncbi:hypothetical protein HN858_05150 [Candidatus Falkowbacteria bacterium]|jgi:hypothetical protein|nr:hypothetical protein [Candidatus Falkowbacteria bacterium]MBT5503027.1 hypothetical protein [Candidatus Falkowbacteria bacterium]MBT7349025.1 hypothetical protein [Candidatus Falkowbacteria bacterium]MBT7500982.1 hypothetical protein [Candidatus Falkowbacteria bacterium]